MAEVTVSVDDEGAIQGVGGAHERWETSAAEVPPAPATPPVMDEQLPPLPSALPLPGEVQQSGVRRREARVTQPIMPDEWVRDGDDYWDTQSLISYSGRTALPRPKPLPLDPPQRFRPVRRWQSTAALVVLSVVILATCVGLLQAAGLANNLLHPHQPVPTLTQPTSSPTHLPSPTAKPHK